MIKNFKDIILKEEMRKVKITFDNDDVILTSMASGISDKTIKDYYKIGSKFNLGTAGKDKMVKVKKVEILK